MPRKNTRRGNKECTIYQRKDGSWCGQVLLGYKSDGKPNRKTFYGKTREIVAEKITNVSSDNFRGIKYVEPSNTTVEQFINKWLFGFKKIEVSPLTFNWYLKIAKNYICPEIGTIPLKDLTAYHIQGLINRKLADGTGTRTLKAIKMVIGQTMKHALETQLITVNPALSAKIPSKDRKVKEEDAKVITLEQRKYLLEIIETDFVMKAMISTLMFTGMRTGEILALPWKNVDFKTKTVTIDRAVTLNPIYDADGNSKGNKTIVAATKTKSGVRKFVVSDKIIDLLKEWRGSQSKRNAAFILPDKPVFCNKNGDNMTYGGFRSLYRKFLAKYGLSDKDFHLHLYRHTFSTMLLENGVNPKIVQKLLGHKTIQITLDTYSHVLTELYTETADTIDGIYEAISSPAVKAV